MDSENIGSALHPLERKVLPALVRFSTVPDLVKETKLKQVEVVRALQWLENKKLVKVSIHRRELIDLDVNGKKYVKSGLPERRFLDSLADKPISMDALTKKSGLSREEMNVCIGSLRREGLISLKKEKGLSISITAKGHKAKKDKLPEEELLKKQFPVEVDKLNKEETKIFAELKRRKKIITVELHKDKIAKLTPLGQKVARSKLDLNVVESLTTDMLRSGSWKGKQFRRYDVSVQVPKISGGRRHFVSQATNYIRKIWVDMGFTEMEGSLLQTSFWNLDALFVPQDHPARELQDTFYINNPANGKLPLELSQKVKAVHETGGKTGSKGWRNPWRKEIASRNLLRTHTTVLSAQTLAKLKKSDLPAKFFAVGRVFRNEALDWKHLFEFSQVEGIVVDPKANLRHLKGYLREFYTKLGFTRIRMVPSYFPYTEPSLEVYAFHPIKKEWVEVGGAGIFRPEVTIPLLGHDIPVLAWGQGLERIIVEYYKIADLRELYRNDLKQLREIKEWTR